MDHIFVSDLEAGMKIAQFFVVRKIEHRTTSRGDPYWDLLLADRSGSIPGKVWSDDIGKCDPGIRSGTVAGVRGRVEQFRDTLQIHIHTLAGIDYLREKGSRGLKKLDLSLLLPHTPYAPEELWQDLLEICTTRIADEDLRRITLTLLNEHEDRFKEAPAALEYHHAYRGGLLEHTWEVVRYASALAEVIPGLDRDVLLAGAVLHDIGKLVEIEGEIAYRHSASGRLLGHIVLGRDLIRDAAARLEVNPNGLKLLHLEHIVLSHHGEVEWGSPVPPMSREAYLIHTVDNLNAKLKMMDDHSGKRREDRLFTEYHRVLKRRLFLPPQEPDEPEEEPLQEEDAPDETHISVPPASSPGNGTERKPASPKRLRGPKDNEA